MTARSRDGIVERIDRACAGATEERALRERVLEILRSALVFDAYVWLITDPVTGVGYAPLADVPCLPELPRLIRLKYLTTTNRWTALARRVDPVGLLRRDTNGDLSRSTVWRELLRGYGIADVASVAFADRAGCWGFLDLWRTDAAAPFGEDDARLLAEITPRLTLALREAQARTFREPAVPGARDLGPVVTLLDDDLSILGQTAATDSWLHVLLPGPEGRAPIPASIWNVAAQLHAVEAGIDRRAALARAHLANGLWITLRAARLEMGSARKIVVTMEEASARDRIDVFTRAFALTPRETELVGHLANGCDTHDLAQRMYLSEHTVQDHLKAIFAKTSDHSRRSLMSRALGTQL